MAAIIRVADRNAAPSTARRHRIDARRRRCAESASATFRRTRFDAETAEVESKNAPIETVERVEERRSRARVDVDAAQPTGEQMTPIHVVEKSRAGALTRAAAMRFAE